MLMAAHLKALIPGLLALPLLLAAFPGHAEVDSYRLYLAARGDIPWQSLSPEEQQALRRHRGNWDNYSKERQQDMRSGARRYLELPADKRRAVDQQRHKYQNMSPRERQRLREEYQQQRR